MDGLTEEQIMYIRAALQSGICPIPPKRLTLAVRLAMTPKAQAMARVRHSPWF